MGRLSPSHIRETNRKSIKISLILLFLFMSMVCMCLGACNMISKKTESLWILIDGFILSSDIETHVIEGENKDHTSSIFYNAVAQFQYIVDGQTYVNRHTLSYVRKNDPTQARTIMNDFPEGRVVRVAYNPVVPSQSRIVTSSSGTPFVFLITGMLFLMGSVLVHRLIKVKSNTGKAASPKAVHHSEKLIEGKHEISRKVPPSPKPQSELSGSWKLDYQVPSMREIISSTQKGKQVHQIDRNAVLSSGGENLTVHISDHEIEFKYMDAKNQGSCDILSRYLVEGNTMSLDHQSMDFLMVDIQDFPPTSYTISRTGSKLILTSGEIRGLDSKKISYHLSRAQ